jgi:hypothetical protein
MSEPYLVIPSRKVGLDSRESYVVVRSGTSFLRVLGDEPKWELMTATASEDHGRIAVCADQPRLIEAAMRLCAEFGTSPNVVRDHAGREYVKVGTVTRGATESDEEFEKENSRVLSRFFEIYDSLNVRENRSPNEMRDLYDALTDSSGEDIYLSDGVWLSSDGSLSDRGA